MKLMFSWTIWTISFRIVVCTADEYVFRIIFDKMDGVFVWVLCADRRKIPNQSGSSHCPSLAWYGLA